MSNKDIQRLPHNVHGSLRSCTFLFDLSRVVEELVYNSLDAGSTKIVISLCVKSYYAKVDDDGCGITRDGLAILGERYATSKFHLLANASTETLGFRGEALSSISDVSLLEIRSKARGNPNAYSKIIKSSRCLYFGIDDKREDVGTTVIVRELFFNQPIRRKFMQSSFKKVLYSVKKCIFRIALVHPYVSFKVFEIEREYKLLCTMPYPSSLPLVTEGFGNEVSSILKEFSYSAQEFTISGYISGPTDAISTKVFQYIYINARFICKNSINILINSLATSFQFTDAEGQNNSENQWRKRQKPQGYPAFLLNLCCPMTSYDICFETSKTIVEFKDWHTILSLFEQAIKPYWEQFESKKLREESAAGEAFQERDILKEGVLSKVIVNNSDFKPIIDGFNFYQDSISLNPVSISMGTSPGKASTYKKYSRLYDEQAFNSLQGTITNIKQSGDINYRSVPCDIVTNYQHSPIAASSRNTICLNMKNEVANEHHNCLKEPFSYEECTAGSNWYNKCPHRSDKIIFEKNISNSLLQATTTAQQSAIGVIRHCQKWKQRDISSSEFSPTYCEKACLPEKTSFSYECADNDSKFSDLEFTKMWEPPNSRDIQRNFNFIQNNEYMQDFDCQHYAIEDKNAKFVDTVLNESGELLPHLIRTGSTAVNRNYFSSSRSEFPLYKSTAVKTGSTSPFYNTDYLEADFLGVRIAKDYNTLPVKFAEHVTAKSSSKNKKFRSLNFNAQDVKMRRSHSAPPFFKGKKKFPILSCLSTNNATKFSIVSPSHCVNNQELNCQLEPFNASQPSLKLIDELRQPSIRGFEKNNIKQKDMTVMQTFEEINSGKCIIYCSATNKDVHCRKIICFSFVVLRHYIVGFVPDKVDSTSASLTKWRTGDWQPSFCHDAVLPQKADVLDISSGILHLAGSLLVPASLNKNCFDTARVLLQLDCKFIPVIASGILVIIDQHAADERIRLEELRKKVLNGELCSGTYLNPEHELALPEMGYQLLQKYAEQIKRWGWIYRIDSQCSESFTRSMNFLRQQKSKATLVAVPHILGTDLTSTDLLEFIEQLVETDGSCVIPPAVIRILNYKACRGAVMFGDALLPSECSLIVDELKATSLCFQCAHGRPTTVPLLDMSALHEQLARLDRQATCQSGEWHGLRKHPPSIHRARQRLELCKRFLHE